MPTGLTAPVLDGEITEFNDFALRVARSFGPLATLRDHELTVEATKRYIELGTYMEDDTYVQKGLRDANEEYAKLAQMTLAEILTAMEEEKREVAAKNEEMKAENEQGAARYDAMLAKVQAWTPPTPDHQELKNYMIEQLEHSKEFDCRGYEYELPESSPSQWLRDQLSRAADSIAFYERLLKERETRNEYRKKWVTALVESLEMEDA